MRVESLRRFICGMCRVACFLCTRCDRGHRYCSRACSVAARTAQVRNTQKDYELTLKGKKARAARQQRLRQRRAKRVTHQGPDLHGEIRNVALPVDRASVGADAVTKDGSCETPSSFILRCSLCRCDGTYVRHQK